MPARRCRAMRGRAPASASRSRRITAATPPSSCTAPSLALRAAKKAGGDTFRVYAREMEMAVEARLQMEKAISDGLHQGWFELHFQPQYDLRTRRLTGFEALVRMNHPELGELLPARLPADRRRERADPAARRVDHPRRLRDGSRMAAASRRCRSTSRSRSSATATSRTPSSTRCRTPASPASRLRVEISEAVLLGAVGLRSTSSSGA